MLISRCSEIPVTFPVIIGLDSRQREWISTTALGNHEQPRLNRSAFSRGTRRKGWRCSSTKGTSFLSFVSFSRRVLTIQQKNRSERDAFSEALFAGEGKEEVAGWIEGYLYKKEGPDGGYGEDGMGDDGKVEEEGEIDGVDEVTEKTEEVTLKEE